MIDQIEIPLSKNKLTLMLIGSFAFIADGLWFVIKPPTISNSIFGNPTHILTVGNAAILFFGFCALAFQKMDSNVILTNFLELFKTNLVNTERDKNNEPLTESRLYFLHVNAQTCNLNKQKTDACLQNVSQNIIHTKK